MQNGNQPGPNQFPQGGHQPNQPGSHGSNQPGPNQFPQGGNHPSFESNQHNHGQLPEAGNQLGPHQFPDHHHHSIRPGQNPHQGGPSNGRPNYEHNGDTQNRVDGDDKFATDAFFGGSENTHREWTDEDEMKWQATTKAPYFENKVPGLECTLPASAVLGLLLRDQANEPNIYLKMISQVPRLL